MAQSGSYRRVARPTAWLIIAAAVTFGCLSLAVRAAAEMKPFVLASTSKDNFAETAKKVKTAVAEQGFEIVGEYSPYPDAQILVVTNDELKKAAASHDRAGYVAPQRISITKVGDEITRAGDQVQVAYTNPLYMAAAYRVDADLSGVADALEAALGAETAFGSEKGLSAKKLAKYHYTFGMEYFDEPTLLASYDSFAAAVAVVEENLAMKKAGVSKVYSIFIPDTEQAVFGVSMKADAEAGNKYMDEAFIMREIDFKPVRSTPHLPYEILVKGGDVEALHGRFRIAMNFPDLSMMGSNSFMNIMPSPDAIAEALTRVAGGEVDLEL